MTGRAPARAVLFVLGVLGAVLVAGDAAAQNKRESQLWAGAFVTAKVGDARSGPALWLDLHARRGPDSFTGIVRPGLGWRFSPSVALWGGYAWVPTFQDSDAVPDVHEHRIWQQLIYQGNVGPLSMQLRPRLEQRFREGEDVAVRFRIFGRLNARLWHGGPLAIATWVETFLQLGETSWGAPGGFDQNRLFLGLGYTRGDVRVEPGYLNVTTRQADGSVRVQHNLAMMVFWAF